MKRALQKNPPEPAVVEPESDLFWEAKVADALGVSRELVRSLRQDHLNEGADFRTIRGAVVLSAQGLARINDLLSPKDKVAPSSAPTANALEIATTTAPIPAGPPARARFYVVRVPANKHLLYCVPEGQHGKAAMVLIRVKQNEFFMKGMTFEAIELEHGTWQYRGRLPRRKGRWK